MIFFNGASDPNGVSYNGTTLENVYFNGTLVWTQDKSEADGSGSGTSGISGGGYAVDVPEISFEGQTGNNPAPSSISNTVSYNFGPSRYAYFNGLEKFANVIYCDSNMTVVGNGAEYRGTVSTELVFNPSDYTPVSGDNKFYVFDSGLMYDTAYINWSGFPSSMGPLPAGYISIKVRNDVSVTCTAVLSGGGTVTRVYTGTLIMSPGINYIYGDARGDESKIAAATSGYVVQEDASLYLMFSQ